MAARRLNRRALDARHEASHAVIAWLAGARCSVRLRPEGVFTGGCETDPLPPAVDLLVCLAGPVADAHRPGWLLDQDAADLVNAASLASTLRPDDPEGTLARAAWTVRAILALPRIRAVRDALADVLCARGELSPDEVDSVIVQGLGAILVGDGAEDKGSERS